MKVYVVTSGEYSDYDICAIFNDKALAVAYCAINNQKFIDHNLKHQTNYGEEFRIEEYDTMDNLILANSDNRYGYLFDERWVRQCVNKKYDAHGTLCIWPGSNRPDGYIFIEGQDEQEASNKAKKIVADEMAMEKAIKEGIV